MSRPKRPAHKRPFTELLIRKLKPKPAAYVVWDTHLRGLAIRVQPTGAKAFKVIYSRFGRPRWLHLGSASAIGLADARLRRRGGGGSVNRHASTYAEARCCRHRAPGMLYR
jgi:hypothetical protein